MLVDMFASLAAARRSAELPVGTRDTGRTQEVRLLRRKLTDERATHAVYRRDSQRALASLSEKLSAAEEDLAHVLDALVDLQATIELRDEERLLLTEKMSLLSDIPHDDLNALLAPPSTQGPSDTDEYLSVDNDLE